MNFVWTQVPASASDKRNEGLASRASRLEKASTTGQFSVATRLDRLRVAKGSAEGR